MSNCHGLSVDEVVEGLTAMLPGLKKLKVTRVRGANGSPAHRDYLAQFKNLTRILLGAEMLASDSLMYLNSGIEQIVLHKKALTAAEIAMNLALLKPTGHLKLKLNKKSFKEIDRGHLRVSDPHIRCLQKLKPSLLADHLQ